MNNLNITVEFTPTNIENLFIVSDLDTRLKDSSAFSFRKDCLFGAVN